MNRRHGRFCLGRSSFILAAVVGVIGCDGATGEPGEPGEQGEQGDPGQQGEPGEPGQAGSGSGVRMFDATGADMGIVMPGYWSCECPGPGASRCAHVYDENLDAALAYLFDSGDLCQPRDQFVFFESDDCTGAAYLGGRGGAPMFAGIVVTDGTTHYKLSTTAATLLISNSKLREDTGCLAETDLIPLPYFPVDVVSPTASYQVPFQLAAQ